MASRKSSFDEYNATCNSTNDGDDLNRAILMSFSETLSSTQHNFTADSLTTTSTVVNSTSNVDSTIVEKTISHPFKKCPPKEIVNEISFDPRGISRKNTFVSRIPKYGDGKSKQQVVLKDDEKSKAVRTKDLHDVENIRQSNLWPALTALETSLHSDDQTSPDDTSVLKKLDEKFSASPRRFTETLMTIIEESFAGWEEGQGDVSRYGLMELLKSTEESTGNRLEDESPPEFMSSCSGRSKRADNEAKNNSAGLDCDNDSIENFISLPSENQIFASESAKLPYASREALTITTERMSTKQPNQYVNTATITLSSATPANFTTWAANCRGNRTSVKRMPESPASRPKVNAVSFECVADESPQSSYLSLEALMTTGAGRIATKEPKEYAQTPRIIVDPSTPTSATYRAANRRGNRTPVRKTLRSPVSRSKANAVSFEGVADESPQSSYLSLQALRMTTDAGRISTKEPKKYTRTPRITVDPGTPTNATYRSANRRGNRTPVRKTLRSPVSRPTTNSPRFQGIVDRQRASPISSPLSNKDDDEYLTAESETEDPSEDAVTNESPKKKLDMSNIASHHRNWVTTFEQHTKYIRNTPLSAAERRRKLACHSNKLEMRWVKKLEEKRQKCFVLVDEMLRKSDTDPSEPKVKSPCSCSPCVLSKEFCGTLLALQEYMRYAMNVPEVAGKRNGRFITSGTVNLKPKIAKNPRAVRTSMGNQRKSLGKIPSPRVLNGRVKSTLSPRNRGVSHKKTKETRVDTSSIRTVSELRRVFSPRPGAAGCSESKETIPKKIPWKGPSRYRNVVSPVGLMIRGKKSNLTSPLK